MKLEIKTRSGFTLVEVIVYLALFALITTFLFQNSYSASQSSAVVYGQTDELLDAITIHDFFKRKYSSVIEIVEPKLNEIGKEIVFKARVNNSEVLINCKFEASEMGGFPCKINDGEYFPLVNDNIKDFSAEHFVNEKGQETLQLNFHNSFNYSLEISVAEGAQ